MNHTDTISMAEFNPASSFFTAFRKTYGFPYFYREQPLDWFRHMGMWGVGIIYIIVVLVITVIIAFLGTRGYSRWRVALQMIITLSIGCSIIVCVTGTFWQVAHYENMDGNDTVRYHLHIGLNQANITMARMPAGSTQYSEFHNVKIGWIEVQQAEEEYREALMRGWPAGILRLARYISVDEGEMRYMRDFRASGYAVWVLLWTAFASWLLANILIGSHITYAAFFFFLTGIFKLMACIVYDVKKPKDFYIPMDDGQGKKLQLSYNWMYWLTLFMALFVILISVIILVLDYLRPADMNQFFGTSSEFISPYDDSELVQNQNKDIRGIIRSMSIKRASKRGSKRQTHSDVEKTRKTPFSSYNSNRGNAETPYETSMMDMGDNLDKRMDRQRENISPPEIQVEMVSLDAAENGETTPNNNDRGDKDNNLDIDSGSETDSEKHNGVFQLDDSSMPLDGVSGLRPRVSIVSQTSSQQQLITEN